MTRTNCINCGAPLDLKRDTCAYCSTAIVSEPMNALKSTLGSYQIINRQLASHDDFMDSLRYGAAGEPIALPGTFKGRILDHIVAIGQLSAIVISGRGW